MGKICALLFLVMVSAAGCGSIAGTAITASQTTTVPTGLAVTQTTSTSATLTWSRLPGDVFAYKIYRDGTQIGTTSNSGISTLAATTFTDANLTPSTTYLYSIAASSLLGSDTAASPTVTVTTLAAGATLDPPGQLTVTRTTSSSVTITWSPAGNGSTTPLTYKIYRNNNYYIGSIIASPGVADISFTDTNLTSGTTYSYSVTVSTESGLSNQVSATTQGGVGVVSINAVVTLAGSTGIHGGSADAVGRAAGFSLPNGVVQVGGTLYVADSGNNTIRRIDLASAAVTTLAGTAGTSGSSDGAGSVARFNLPRGLATDGTSLYVADSGNNTIRRIDIDSGEVSTLAGSKTRGFADGIGTGASFNLPRGIATDGSSLYVADSLNNAIRKIVIGSGAVSTLAGSTARGATDGFGTAAGFFVPYGIARDGNNLYVTDTGNNTIRKIVIASAQVTTVAGSAGVQGSADGSGSTASFFNPDGIASDGTSLYLTDTCNNTVRRVVLVTGEVTTVAGSPAAHGAADGSGTVPRFYAPRGIVLSGTDLFVADSLNNTIRRIALDLMR